MMRYRRTCLGIRGRGAEGYKHMHQCSIVLIVGLFILGLDPVDRCSVTKVARSHGRKLNLAVSLISLVWGHGCPMYTKTSRP